MGEVVVQADLAAWLLEQVQADEDLAKSCAEDPLGYGPIMTWVVGGEEDVYYEESNLAVAVGPYGGGVGDPQASHIARWDPARVLVECDTKRRIIELLAASQANCFCDSFGHHADEERMLRFLALPYADRPGYRAEWAPDGRA